MPAPPTPNAGASYQPLGGAALDQEARDAFLAYFPKNKRSTISNWFLQPIRELHADTPLLVVTLLLGQLRKRLDSQWCIGQARADAEHAIEMIEVHRNQALDCAQYYLDYAALPEDERQEIKRRQRSTHMDERPPSDRQINYLRVLGHRGEPPVTMRAASEAIDRLLHARGKAGRQ